MKSLSDIILQLSSSSNQWARVLGVVTGTVITGGGAWTVYNLAATTQESQTRKGVQGQEQPRDEGAGLNIPRGWLASERLRDALIGTAAVSGCLGVACGAYGFHGLRSRWVSAHVRWGLSRGQRSRRLAYNVKIA